MKYILLLFLFINIPFGCTAQKMDTVYYCNKHSKYHPSLWDEAIAMKTGYRYSNYHILELGVEWLTANRLTCEMPFSSAGISAGADILFDHGLVYGPKISAEIEILMLGGRMNATYYTSNFSSGSFKLRPELGLTIVGFLNLYYGYTFNISNAELYKQKHSITLYANIPVLKYYGNRRIKRKDSSK